MCVVSTAKLEANSANIIPFFADNFLVQVYNWTHDAGSTIYWFEYKYRDISDIAPLHACLLVFFQYFLSP